MTNVKKLNIAITKSGKARKEICKELGLSEMGFYKKSKAITEFKASEIYKLAHILNLTCEEMQEIFFYSGC